MSAPAAIKGTFADFRLIKGRKVAQLVIELPIEEADAALATLGGLPQPAAERWVAIAALNVTSIKPQEKRRYDDLRAAMQAAIRCSDPSFWRFLDEEIAPGVKNDSEAAIVVRAHCGVDSRSALNDNPIAATRWRQLDGRYRAWMRAPQHA